jgi:hypothetical protein
MQILENRWFSPSEIIYKELDEVQDMIFVQSGRYNVGYEINKQAKLRLQFGQRTVIGAFNITFNKRSYFLFMS